jgi:hypothetical protein
MSKIAYVGPLIVVKKVASQLELSPYRLIHDLLKMNVFITSVNQQIETEVAKFICERYGYTLFGAE